jgi:hypothetical protein
MALYDGYGKVIATSAGGAFTQRIINNPNLADPGKFTIGLIGSNGKINTAQTGCNTSDFIPVTPGKTVTLGFIKNYNHNPWFIATRWVERCSTYVFFGEDKSTVVSSGRVSLTENGATGVVVPDGAAYIRASWAPEGGGYYFYPAQTPEWCFVHIADAPTTVPMYWFADNVEKTYIPAESVGYTYQPPYFGKKWVLFGDSLTDAYAGKGWDESSINTGGVGWTEDNTYVAWTGHLWASRIASELGLTIDNRAKSGSNIYYGEGYTYADVNGCIMLDAYIAEVEAGTTECADYITVGFGSNTRTQDIGTNADTSETRTSVYGAMKYFIEKLRYLQKNYNQKMVFGFVLPPQSSWGEGNTRITEGRTAMLAVLNTDEYAVPYCDMWKESGICLDQMTDSIHVASIESNNLYYHAMRRFMMGL